MPARRISLRSASGLRTTGVVWRPKTLTPVEGDAVGVLMKLLEALEDDDDVQNVYANEDIAESELEKLAS